MEFADAAVLAGYPGPATTSTTSTTDVTVPRSTPVPASATPATPAPQTDKLADTPTIDDEDLFLGDDNDNDDNDDEVDNREEADDDVEDDFDEDEDDFDEDYFSSTYRPLSNLPTPPPSSHTSSLAQSPYAGGAYGPSTAAAGSADGSLLGPAVHLVNLLPPAASLATPSVALVQAMLARAQLPLDTVALAVCILDSLDSRFARSWRLTCPLSPPPTPSPSEQPSSVSSPSVPAPPEKRHTLPSPLSPTFPTFAPPSDASRGLHIDAVFPEVIVLAALVIAAKFTDDGFVSQQPAQAYCTAWGASPASSSSSTTGPGPCALWTGAQLAATERCIMQNLGYRILPLMDADLLADAQADMRRAGTQALRARRASAAPSTTTTAAKRVPAKKTVAAIMTPPEEALIVGATSSAVVGLGLLQLTPSAVEQDESRDMVVDTSKIISLNFPSNMQRRHVSSRSESYGRYSFYDR